MNSNDIIKALECCYGNTGESCEECPNRNTCGEIDVIESAIDLIKHQKAEIERLDVLSEQLGKDVDVKLKYIYELEAINESMKEDKPFIKAEAYKEFAERLKDMSKAIWWFDENEPTKVHVEHCVLQSDIDKLVKEMTGERE